MSTPQPEVRREGERDSGHLRRTPSRLVFLLLAGVVLLAAAPLYAADSFYLGMLRRGSDAFNRGDYPEAVKLLRVACFGFLEEPELLVDGLTRLALAQGELGDKEEFLATFERIQVAESRFGAYTKALLAPEQRTAFENVARRLLPAATLKADPTFSRLLPRPEERLAQLPPKQRRTEIENLAKKEPSEVRWPLMLAELELAEGRSGPAARAAETAFRLAPDTPQTLRVRGLALAAEKRWALALADLERLSAADKDPRVLVAILGGLVELERWNEAVTAADSLPAILVSRSDVARLVRRAQDGAQKAAAREARRLPTATPTEPVPTPAPASVETAAPETGQESLTAPPPTPTPRRRSPRATPTVLPTPTPPPTASLSAEDLAALGRAQDLVRANDLVGAFNLARAVADGNPEVGEAQRAAGEMAYRIARWSEAVRYFGRAGAVPDDEPHRQFYFAVSLFEMGERAQAAQELRRCVNLLERTPFVEDYIRKITGT